MKDLIKYIIGALLLLAIAFAILYRIFNGEVLTKENNVAKIIDLDKSPPKITIDQNGNTHAEKEVIDLTDYVRQKYLEKEVDSLKKVIGVKENQIVGLTTANSKFQYEIKYRTDSTDKSNKKYIIDQQSKWFTVKGTIPGDTSIFVEGRDSLTLAFINKKGKLYADISSYNPAMQYYGIRSFMVPEKKELSGLGIGISSATDFKPDLKYNTTKFLGGVKFMHIGKKWMFDVNAGYQYQNTTGLLPQFGAGVYRKIF